MPRYTIAGFRGGEDIRTPYGAVRLHPHDAAAELSAEQVAYFEQGGFTVTKAPNQPPKDGPAMASPLDDEIAERLARNAKEAEAQIAAAHAAPKKPQPSGV